MRRIIRCLFLVILSLPLISGYSFSQSPASGDENKKEQKTWGSYLVSGFLGTSYLLDDIQGDKNLFRSQFNLKEGLNISQISFKANRIAEQSGFFDVISFDLKGFGAEPYGRAAFRFVKRNLFFLNGGYTERKYFAKVASFANPIFDATSDEVLFNSFHTWNTKEKSFDINGRVNAARWLSFDAFWQRTKLEGDSIITLRLLNNEFPLNEPLNQTSNIVRLGSELNIKGRFFYKIYGLYQKYELNQTASSTGTNLGIRGQPSGSSANYITSESRKSTVDMDTWSVSQSFHLVPSRKISIDGGFTKSSTDGKTSGDETVEGRFLWPLYDFVNKATYSNLGELKKDSNKGNVAIHFDLLPQLRLQTGYDFYKYTIENSDTLDYSFYSNLLQQDRF